MRKRVITISLIITIVLIVFYLSKVGYLGIWLEGMASVANNTIEYSDVNGHVLEGEYSVSINLSDLEGNVGKELYNDGINKIYVSYVNNTGSLISGGYIVGFRASGTYSIKEAILVSGIHHATVDENSFTYYMTANMTANYKGEDYTCSISGMSGLNYKDGDEFSFYIFPSRAYETGQISLEEEGIVRLTITSLYKNIWSKN